MLGVSVLFLLIGLCLGGFGLVMLILRITKKGSITLPIIVIPTAFVIVLASFIAVAVNAPDKASADGNEPSEKVEKVNKEKQGKEEKPEEERQTEKKDNKKEVKKDLPADESLENVITDVIGEDRIDTYTYFEGYVTIIAIAEENLTNGMTLSGLQLDTIDILEQAADIDEVDTVSFVWKLPTEDSYGNDAEAVIVKEEFERDTIDRINFDNIKTDKISDIADSYNVHQSFR